MSALFGRGAFAGESVLLSSQSLAAYAIGLPAFVLVKVLAPGFFARVDTATPVKNGVAAVVLNLAMNLAFMVPLQHVGPALATSLAALFNVVSLGVVLARRGHLVLDVPLRSRCLRMTAAAAAMGMVLSAVQQELFAVPLHGFTRISALDLLVAAGVAAYGVAAQLFGAGDVRDVGRMMTRRRGRAKQPEARGNADPAA
jgi:putative peptidoglycan lipid II flippase